MSRPPQNDDGLAPARAAAEAECNALLARLRGDGGMEMPAVRLRRVKAAIARGSLHISAQNIARRLLEKMLTS